MRHEFEALSDVEAGQGDRIFSNKKGDALEVSAAGAEVILNTDLAKSYRHVREIPETPEEKARAEEKEVSAAAERKAALKTRVDSLMKSTREELLEKAGKLGMEGVSDLKKEPLAEAIAKQQLEGDK